ncbi:MAG: MCE family protein [Streptosporangiales bacterium]|nr:MCE family protein [Streptosporangiales bacterium]
MIPFRERNPVPIGAVGLVLVGALAVGAFTFGQLPGIGGRSYVAAFSDASGLRTGDPVEVAGINVGRVVGIELAGDHVEVRFRVDRGVAFGDRTGAAIRLGTLLGDKYLELRPRGPDQLDPGTMIPVSRTEPAYEIVEALSDLTRTTEAIDTERLSAALQTLADTFEDSAPQVRTSLEGLSRLSRTIASRDQQLQQLLSRTESVSGILDQRNEEFSRLARDANLLLAEISKRREVIHQLLVSTAHLSGQLTRLVRENEEQIGPALRRLHEVLDVLQRNQQSLKEGVRALAPFSRILGNVVGNGPWFDAFVHNLVFAGDLVPGPRERGG